MAYRVRQLSPAEFPPLLSEIPDPPEMVRLIGPYPNESSKFLCVVGSRAASSYGKDVCNTLIEGLAGHPIVIISGLALGIDAIAHRAALRAGLLTVAVPGSGLSEKVLYPASHRALAGDILKQGGCLLSPFPDDFRATPYSFPKRNRIMAGLSHAVLVIEAGEKSGTLITSRLATEYNRDVLAVPGSIFAKGSHGSHMLIRLGATPVRSSADILEALGLESTPLPRTFTDLTEEERRLVELLATPLRRDELIELLGIPVSEAQVLLSGLELRGVITETLGEIRLA